MLGDAQWRWLERELRTGGAQLHLVVSSIPVLPVDHPYEKWANFAAARRRLLATLGASGARGVERGAHRAGLHRRDGGGGQMTADGRGQKDQGGRVGPLVLLPSSVSPQKAYRTPAWI